MKKSFIILTLILMGTFAFANTDVNSDIDLDKIESIINLDNVEISLEEVNANSCGFTVYFNDGGSGDWGFHGVFDYIYGCDQSSSSFWNDFFLMLNSVFPGWTSFCVNC